MYADDIVLISSTVTLVQKLLKLCEKEFNEIGLSFNVSKCEAMRVGNRFKTDVVSLCGLNDTIIPWVSELKYLGVYLLHIVYLKINVHPTKVKFFTSFNAICAKLGASASAETLTHLLKTNCLSALLYNLEAVHLTETNINQLTFPLDRSFIKIFHLKNTDSNRLCQYYMYQLPVKMLIDMRKLLFCQNIRNSDCELFGHFFGYCSAEYFDTLSNKYDLVSNRKLNRNKIVGNMYEIIRSNIDRS